eukprot:TRINITY_DN3423_c0_g1_i2.p1 TRINITY_DN3423_c0_g1~~TRINITY_DN3423_c0_g1_i2.p1  ORF type:complete len:341 (+),score=40.60 TRINITY_DN3423_c0_g1_i2:1033-2055(+)
MIRQNQSYLEKQSRQQVKKTGEKGFGQWNRKEVMLHFLHSIDEKIKECECLKSECMKLTEDNARMKGNLAKESYEEEVKDGKFPKTCIENNNKPQFNSEIIKESKELLIFQAKAAEQAELHEDMVNYMKSAVVLGYEFTKEDHELFKTAYKKFTENKVKAWKTIHNIEQEKSKEGCKYLENIKAFKGVVLQEIKAIRNEISMILDEYLLVKPMCIEDAVSFLEMKATYNRYVVECSEDKSIIERCRQLYKEAIAKANALPITNPTRLSLVNIYSVFLHDTMESRTEAYNLAKGVLDSAITELEHLSDDEYKDSATALQPIKDNIYLWNEFTQCCQLYSDM